MDIVIEKALEIKEELYQLKEVQEYLKLKELLRNNEELKELRNNIAILTIEGKDEQRKRLVEIYNKNPLVINYYSSKEEVMEILNTIQNIIK